MKRISFFIAISMLCSTTILPYVATKNNILLEAKDYGRTPNDLCLEAPLNEIVKTNIANGISGSVFMSNGLRPVSISITNNSDKPMMLAPFYGLKNLNTKGCVDVLTSSITAPKMVPLGAIAGVCGYCMLAFGGAAIVMDDARPIMATIAILLASGFIASVASSVGLNILAKQFSTAMTEKFEEYNFKDETLIMPGKTVKKLLVTQNEAYISRFPVVIYPLEDRQNMIVFDVDLRA